MSLAALTRCERGAITLTVTQMFLGAVSLGISMFRGTEVISAFHHETVLGHANYGASKLAADHGRAANIVVNDNTIMAAIMGPRFGVEADNITMDANAAIACPTCPDSPKCDICRQYERNKPRAAAKLAWVRAKQKALWGSLGKLSGDIDRLASIQAGDLVTAAIAKTDPAVRIRFEDPARLHEIWGGANAGVACRLAVKDTIGSPVLGHAFPLLLEPNLLGDLPKVLVQAFPDLLCAATTPDKPPSVDLGDIGSVRDKTRDECRDLEQEMRCAIAAAKGEPGSCGSFSTPGIQDLSAAPPATSSDRRGPRKATPQTRTGNVKLPQLSKDVEPFIHCRIASPSAPLASGGSGYAYRDPRGQIVTCLFDEDECYDKHITENSDEYLRDKLGLPKIVANVAEALGGSETRAPSSGTGQPPPDFCACSYTTRPIDETVIGITDAVRTIASFGSAGPSEALRRAHEYRSCGKWYFPDKRGEFASVPPDEQPFVGAWKWALVDHCPGGER